MSKNMYALTNPQKSIWLTEQFYKGTSIENITGTVIVSQNVDFDALTKAINLFVKKNDSFRLKFTVKDSTVMQYVDTFTEFNIEKIWKQNRSFVHYVLKSAYLYTFDLQRSTVKSLWPTIVGWTA